MCLVGSAIMLLHVQQLVKMCTKTYLGSRCCRAAAA